MLRLLDADPRSRMPGGASRLWVVVISAVVMAGTALPMVFPFDTADPVDSAAPAEVAQFAAAEEAVTPAEAASGAVDVAPARVAVAPPAVPTTSSQIPAKSPPKTLLPPPPSPHPPQAPPPSPETLLEKQKRLEKEAELLEQERKELQEEHEQLKRNAEAIRLRQRNLTASLNHTCLYEHSTFFIAPFCPFAYDDSEPIVEVHDTAYEITFEIPGLRKEDLTISVLKDGSLSNSGKLLQIIGRTANANMDVGVARAVQLYSDADWDKGLNTTHADGRLTIRVERQTSATLPLWSTWQLQGHLPERIVLNASVQPQYQSKWGSGHYYMALDYNIVRFSEAKLKDVDHKKNRCTQWFCIKQIPSLQWLTQAPVQALNFWFYTANAGGIQRRWPQNPVCISHSKGYCLEEATNDAILDIFTSINEIITKAVSHIENSGGYNIILKPNDKYAIKNGVLSWKPNAKISGAYNMENFRLRLFGNWWSKDVKITRQDGLDGIFIPI